MSKKLYAHLTLTNYANINTKVKKEQKKTETRVPITRQNS